MQVVVSWKQKMPLSNHSNKLKQKVQTTKDQIYIY